MSHSLETEYVSAMQTGQWNRKLEYSTEGEYVALHSPAAMIHYLSSVGINGNLDDWGQVQPQVSFALDYPALNLISTQVIDCIHSPLLIYYRTPN